MVDLKAWLMFLKDILSERQHFTAAGWNPESIWMFPCLFVCVNRSAHVNEYILSSVMVACGVTRSYGDVIMSVDCIWLALLAKPLIGIFLRFAPVVPRPVTRTRFLQPDAEIRSDNLEWAFRSSCKWMCGEGGEITLTRNHSITEIISCHGYQSSFYVVGWIYDGFVQQGHFAGGGLW